VLRVHVSRTDEPFLEPRDISGALIEFEQQQEIERAQPLIAARQAEAARAGQPPARGLYLDEGDHVWVDGAQLESPLSDLEFRLLKALYQAAPAIVSQEDLITAVWREANAGLDDAIYETDEQNVRKLIARIRSRLEPEAAAGAWRFVRNARGRGYWLHVS
jgi:DNA-binding response OmpR family regulator